MTNLKKDNIVTAASNTQPFPSVVQHPSSTILAPLSPSPTPKPTSTTPGESSKGSRLSLSAQAMSNLNESARRLGYLASTVPFAGKPDCKRVIEEIAAGLLSPSAMILKLQQDLLQARKEKAVLQQEVKRAYDTAQRATGGATLARSVSWRGGNGQQTGGEAPVECLAFQEGCERQQVSEETPAERPTSLGRGWDSSQIGEDMPMGRQRFSEGGARRDAPVERQKYSEGGVGLRSRRGTPPERLDFQGDGSGQRSGGQTPA